MKANLLNTGAVALAFAFSAATVTAQEGIRNMRMLESAQQSRRLQLESMEYTFRKGDFRVSLSPSLGVDYNDNIDLAERNAEDDFIFRPMLNATMSYPVTQQNLLMLNVGIGYDDYLENNRYDTWRLTTGTQLSFDMFIKDFRINLHDYASYSRDASQEASVGGRGSGDLARLNNTIGILASYSLRDMFFSAGFDHQNVWSMDSSFQSQDRATEIFSSQAGYVVNRVLTGGVEGTASWTAYDEPLLNDNTSYTVGLFGTWTPGKAITVSPRVGYSFYQFDQTSRLIRTDDANSWYFDITATHAITQVISYSLSVGHEMRPGVQSDLTEEWYVRPNVRWAAFEHLTFSASAGYQHGSQGQANIEGNLEETYDWFNAGIGADWPFAKRFSLGMNYRYTKRVSDLGSREYDQNLVSLTLTYR